MVYYRLAKKAHRTCQITFHELAQHPFCFLHFGGGTTKFSSSILHFEIDAEQTVRFLSLRQA